MPLTSLQVLNVCKYHEASAESCRYVLIDDHDQGKFYCAKLSLTKKKNIDERVAQYYSDCYTKNVDPLDGGAPLGNNCPGFPIMKHLNQGL